LERRRPRSLEKSPGKDSSIKTEPRGEAIEPLALVLRARRGEKLQMGQKKKGEVPAERLVRRMEEEREERGICRAGDPSRVTGAGFWWDGKITKTGGKKTTHSGPPGSAQGSLRKNIFWYVGAVRSWSGGSWTAEITLQNSS